MGFLKRLLGKKNENTALEISYGPSPVAIEQPKYRLSQLIFVGRHLHDRAAPGQFVEHFYPNDYAYNRQLIMKTCAIAAAGAALRMDITQPTFSFSETVWRIHKATGVNIRTEEVQAPNGEMQPIDQVVTTLADKHFWSRRAIAGYLQDCGY